MTIEQSAAIAASLGDTMTQSRTQSMIETAASTAIGFGVALATTAVVLPMFGLRTSASDDIGITVIFTVVSLVRQYAVRRLFNRIHGCAE